MARLSNELVNVLSQVEGPKTEVYFIYPEEMRQSKRINVFRDFLVRKVAETADRFLEVSAIENLLLAGGEDGIVG